MVMSSRTVHPNVVLAICCMSLLVVSMDATAVNVALPSIGRDLHAGTSDLQWVVDSYTMVIASFLMLSGSLADRIGRRRVFQTGMALFMFASVLCSLAPSVHFLIAARMFQAIGGSMLNPVAMSIIANTFVEPKQRARAIGVWGAVVGISMALGPVVGGALTQTVGWRAIFWINVPIGVVAVLLTQRFVPESKAPEARRVDPVGQALVFVCLTALVYSVIEGPRRGWRSPLIEGLFVASACALVGLLVYEPRREQPLLELRFFRSIPFSSATIVAVTMFGSFAGFVFLNAFYLQTVRGLSPFMAGACTLPIAIMTSACAPISGRFVGQYGTRPSLLIAGLGVGSTGVFFALVGEHTPIAAILVAYAVFGVGFGFVNPPITNTAVSGMPRTRAGLAAAVASTSRLVGSSLGVAIAGTMTAGDKAGRHKVGAGFTASMHGFFWIVFACGALTIVIAFVANGRRARESVERIAALLDPPSERAGFAHEAR
jgi:EmrB/QacA subfamily drug resistance transporter